MMADALTRLLSDSLISGGRVSRMGLGDFTKFSSNHSRLLWGCAGLFSSSLTKSSPSCSKISISRSNVFCCLQTTMRLRPSEMYSRMSGMRRPSLRMGIRTLSSALNSASR